MPKASIRSFLFTCLLAGIGTAWGQDATSGQIVGNLLDPSGATVPSAQVTIKNLETGQTITVPANSIGHYVAPLLPPGSYSVSASPSGFGAVTKSPIVVITRHTLLEFLVG